MRISTSGRLPATAAVLILILGFGVATAPSGAAVVPAGSYVSLGDSYTSGPLIPVQRTDPLGCLRSTNNYPSVLAPSLVITTHVDPSCSGATTADMAGAQSLDGGGSNAPQLNSLSRSTTVVTLGIGGNDIGFIDIAETCGEKSVTAPTGSPCKDFYTSGGVDQLGNLITQTGPKVAAVITAIHRRAPAAKVFVVGYPDILPLHETTASWLACYPTLPIAYGDVSWLRDHVEAGLDSMLQKEAQANHAVFVDTWTPSVGHDACQPETTRWIEPVVPSNAAAPVHPNANGMKGMAAAVLAAMKANGVATR